MSDPTIVVRDNGPLLVTGIGKVEDADGNAFDTGGKETIALERCEGSGPAAEYCAKTAFEMMTQEWVVRHFGVSENRGP